MEQESKGERERQRGFLRGGERVLSFQNLAHLVYGLLLNNIKALYLHLISQPVLRHIGCNAVPPPNPPDAGSWDVYRLMLLVCLTPLPGSSYQSKDYGYLRLEEVVVFVISVDRNMHSVAQRSAKPSIL